MNLSWLVLSVAISAVFGHDDGRLRGVCPVEPVPLNCAVILRMACRSNSDCRRGQLCCSDNCGSTCKDTVRRGRPGSCPAVLQTLLPIQCPNIVKHYCDTDHDCPKGNKCCSGHTTSCSRTCEPVGPRELPRPGRCPRPLPLNCQLSGLIRRPSCKSDGECRPGYKCCKDICGLACLPIFTPGPPRPGRCPRPLPLNCQLIRRPWCKSDEECRPGYKCCKDNCGLACQPIFTPGPGPIRPGVCPKSSGNPGICEFDPKRNCLNDDKCPKGQKCCSEGCGRVCKSVVRPSRPGRCPRPLPTLACVKLPNRCNSDADCRRGDKCCPHSINCYKRCQRAVRGYRPRPGGRSRPSFRGRGPRD